MMVSSKFVTPAGFEPAISWMRTRYPRPLDDGAYSISLNSFDTILLLVYIIAHFNRDDRFFCQKNFLEIQDYSNKNSVIIKSAK